MDGTGYRRLSAPEQAIHYTSNSTMVTWLLLLRSHGSSWCRTANGLLTKIRLATIGGGYAGLGPEAEQDRRPDTASTPVEVPCVISLESCLARTHPQSHALSACKHSGLHASGQLRSAT
jgi:hypothetical protein